MKMIIGCLIPILLIGSCRGQEFTTHSAESKPVRSPAFAGKFYPADSTKLREAIRLFLSSAKPAVVIRPVAIIVPHAGYIFSGQIGADGYNQARGGDYDLIVVLGTNHSTAGMTRAAVYPKGSFDTPIGGVPVDDIAAQELLRSCTEATSDISVHEKEHSVEVQVPFIKYLFPHAKILPVIVGGMDKDKLTKFGKCLAQITKNRKALIVASSDLSHYPQFEDAVRIDKISLDAVAGLDLDRIGSEFKKTLERNIHQLETCACGEAPISAAVAAAKELGATRGTIISYSNSGYNSAGRADRVVGYGAVAIGKGNAAETVGNDIVVSDSTYRLSSSDRRKLLKYARSTLRQIFATETVPLPRNLGDLMKLKRGVFVTLRENGELRGCIGSMIDERPLGTVVGAMTLQAAFNDTRFQPLTEEELRNVDIEISILTPFREVGSASDIVLGRDGVVLRKGGRQAVFLPQVAAETGWGKETFLDQLCLKAGLRPGDYKDAQLYTFQADVFGESEYKDLDD